MKDDTDWFKLFCKQNRFRFCMSEDNWPIAKSIGKWTDDQFYEGFGEGIIGIFVKRDTPPFHRLLGDLWKEAALFVEPEEAGNAARAVSSTDRERMRIAGQGLIEMLLWTRLKYEEYIGEDGMHDSLWALARGMELIIASDSEKSVKGQVICRNHFPNW